MQYNVIIFLGDSNVKRQFFLKKEALHQLIRIDFKLTSFLSLLVLTLFYLLKFLIVYNFLVFLSPFLPPSFVSSSISLSSFCVFLLYELLYPVVVFSGDLIPTHSVQEVPRPPPFIWITLGWNCLKPSLWALW